MLRLLLFSLLLSTALPIEAAPPVALVTELSGAATLSLANARPGALELLQDLEPGTRLTLTGGARAVVVHTVSGVVYELTGPGSFRVQAKTVDGEGTARIARRDLPPEIRAYRLNPAVAAQASVVLRGGPLVRVEGPDGGVLTEDELRYSVRGDLRQARLDVLDDTGATVLTAEGAATYQLAGRYAWIPGQRYAVQVTGRDTKDRPVALTAHFVLVRTDNPAQLRSQRPGATAAPTEWIVYALALESVGADASARSIWHSLPPSR